MIPAEKIKWIIENIEPEGFKWYSEFITDEVFGEDESSIDECKEKAILYIVDKIRGEE